MKKSDYLESMNALQRAYLQQKQNKEFWDLIDILPSYWVTDFNEKLLETKKLLGNDYLLIVGINVQYRSTKSISVKQKRASVLFQIYHWDTISFKNELF